MKLMLRAKMLGKKITLISAAFVLAVSTLAAAVPFIAAEQASAIGEQVGNTWRVSTFEDLKEALGNPSRNHITLDADISATESLILSRSNVTINAGGHTITGPNLGGVWVSNGNNYGLKIYKASNVKINSLRVTGANVGVQINGSQVEFRGHTKVDGNVFGGIELSKGAGVTETPSLLHQQGTLQNATEENGKPTIWAVGEASVTSTIVSLAKATHVVDGQTQYYLNAANSGTVVTNTSTGETFTGLQEAIDDADTVNGHVLDFNKSALVTSQVTVNKGVTINGNGFTLASSFAKTDNSNNSALGIQANDVTVNNLIVDGAEGVNLHGINVYHAQGVELNQVSVNNNTNSGLTVGESANVTAVDISTSNNGWYGINVDKANATFTVKGVSTHSEGTKAHIYSDNRADVTVKVIDVAKQYVRWWSEDGYKYLLDESRPTITSTLNKTLNPTQLKITASDDQRLQYIDVSIYKGNNTDMVKIWGDTTTLVDFEKDYSAKLSNLESGDYVLRATATDILGKATNALNVPFTVDHVNPVATITSPSNNGTVSGAVTVAGVVADENPMNSFFRITGPDNYKLESKYTDGRTLHELNWNTVGLATGLYKIQFETRDLAQNKNTGSVDVIYVTVDNTPPEAEIQGNAFTVMPDHLIVEFTPLNFTDATDVTVDLFDANNVKLASQSLAAAEVAGLVNGNTGPISSPFYIPAQADPYWDVDPAYSWTKASNKPAYAVVTVTDANQGSKSTTISYVDTNESSPITFTSLIANAPAPTIIPPNSFAPAGGAPAALRGGQPEAGTPQFPSANGLPGALEAADTTIPEADVAGASDAKGATDILAQAVDADNTNGEALGLAWYWWLVIVAGVAALVWWIVAMIRGRNAQA